MRTPVLVLAAAMLAGAVQCADAQQAIRNRSVRIVEPDAAPDAPSQPVPAPLVLPPSPNQADPAINPLGVRIDLMPGTEVAVGAKMALNVSTQKPGYLLVVDVDSGGRLTQIYPNTQSLADAKGSDAKANLLTREKPRTVPDPKEKASFQFVAAPPTGVGMVVAILSDKPVQMIDLPNVPPSLAGKPEALEYLRQTATGLLILPATDSERIEEPKWSFATKFYLIR